MLDTVYTGVQKATFDARVEQQKLVVSECTGAVLTFTGLVREFTQGDRVKSLFIESYPGMTEPYLQAIGEQAQKDWHLQGVRIIHRIGLLKPTEPIVFIGVSSRHRDSAFSANRWLIEQLKGKVPLWKREQGPTKTYWLKGEMPSE